jgi:16S rRNA (guanine(1405)-N(7))-methyltransferase
MIFLFKVLPTLERQQRGAARSLLRGLEARTIVVSFPTRSLGGREKGMERGFERFMDDVLNGWNVQIEKLTYPAEIFFLLHG